MNDVERLESLRGDVQYLGTVSIEDTRWLWEMARRGLIASAHSDDVMRSAAAVCVNWYSESAKVELGCQLAMASQTRECMAHNHPPLPPRRKRCRKCDGDGSEGTATDGRATWDVRCRQCGGEGYQEVSDE